MVDYTYNDIILSMSAKLAEAGIENSYWEARELAGAALGFNCRAKSGGSSDKLKTTHADAAQLRRCAAFLARRLSHEPLQYIIGEWDFYGLTLNVGFGVLIPRADTETLIDMAKTLLGGKNDIIAADLCSGSGCIALALEKTLHCKEIYALEKSEAAYDYLLRNIKRNDSSVAPVLCDVLDKKSPEYVPAADLIVCNPPYICKKDMQSLQKEITFEPAEALYGGEDGLDYYRDIVRIWKKRLSPDGIMMFEVGFGQDEEVMEIMIQAGLKDVRAKRDMAGISRCVYGRYPEGGPVSIYESLQKI